MVTGSNNWVPYYQHQMSIVPQVAHQVLNIGNSDATMILFANWMNPTEN